jgi:hypothetical protein
MIAQSTYTTLGLRAVVNDLPGDSISRPLSLQILRVLTPKLFKPTMRKCLQNGVRYPETQIYYRTSRGGGEYWLLLPSGRPRFLREHIWYRIQRFAIAVPVLTRASQGQQIWRRLMSQMARRIRWLEY